MPGPTPERVRGRLLLGAALAALVAISFGLAYFASAGPSALSPPGQRSFPGWFAGPLHFLDPGLRLPDLTARWAFAGAMVAMFVAYLVCLRRASDLPKRWAIGAIVALHAIFLLSPPLQLSDLFNYLHYGRMAAFAGLNPYVHIPAAYANDSAYVFTTWHHLRAPYGPLFTLLAEALAPLGVVASYWLLKAAVALASLGCLALLWRICRRLGRPPLQAIVFVGLNPVVLVWGLGGAHNDFFELLGVLGAVELALSRREALGGAALVAAVAIKASAGLLLPIYVFGARRPGRALLGVLLAGGAALGISLLAFGGHGPNLVDQSRIVANLSVPNGLGLLLGLGGETAGVRLVFHLALLAALAAGCAVAWRRVDWVTPAGWVTFALLLALSWALPWYVLWLLPLAALSAAPALRRAALVLSVFLLLQWVPVWGEIFEAVNWTPHNTAIGHHNDDVLFHYLR